MKEVSTAANVTKKTSKRSSRKSPVDLTTKMPFVAFIESNMEESQISVDLRVKSERERLKKKLQGPRELFCLR